MCELFAVNADREISPNEWLREFFSHGEKNPHGWGMALCYGRKAVALEKEPVRADRSRYLKERLRQDIHAAAMIAHIREATIGTPDYCNTHPFVDRDRTGRCWTLAHNGTIFEGDVLQPFVHRQEGHTDSERILCYIVEEINRKTSLLQRELREQERCRCMDEIIKTIVPGNKLNLMVYDGDILYVHTNMADTLYCCTVNGKEKAGSVRIFATVPFPTGTGAKWDALPLRSLCAYKDGCQIYQGEPHPYAYLEDPEKMRYLYMMFAGL